MSHGQCSTIRAKLLKGAHQLRLGVRRVRLTLPKDDPRQDLFGHVALAL